MIRGTRRVVLVMGSAILVVLGCVALAGPTAQARTQSVCCFRVTVQISGEALAKYTKVDATDSQGEYDYDWGGTAYGLAHLQGTTLVTDRGVAAGYLIETNGVKDSEGRPRDRNDAGCSQGWPEAFQRERLGKTLRGNPSIGLGSRGGLALGRPFEDWELKCGSLSTETLSDLQAGNHAWLAPRQFFFSTHINGLSARQLAKGNSQTVTCAEHSKHAQRSMSASGFSAVSINLVHFSPDDLKRQQRRLAGFLGKRLANLGHPRVYRLTREFLAGKSVPGNGCHTG